MTVPLILRSKISMNLNDDVVRVSEAEDLNNNVEYDKLSRIRLLAGILLVHLVLNVKNKNYTWDPGMISQNSHNVNILICCGL